ncbi:MAG: TauD/TfdA family dioxygenase [Actinomycetota bacterium]
MSMGISESPTVNADDFPTPDFYRYEWIPLASATVDGRFVRVRWSDGAELEAFDWWLRENAVGAGGVDLATREGLLDPAHHIDETAFQSVEVTPEGALRISWAPDSTLATYHPGWLRHVADGQHRAASWLATPQSWTAADLPEPPTYDGTHALTDDDVLAAWVDDLLRYGIARLRGCPTELDFNRRLGERIGAIRDTNFGPIWDVKADISLAGTSDANSTANTSLRLGPHTDLPTRETPPGFQFLHCVANETLGGHSTMADGLAIIDEIASDHPQHYEALTTLNWVFFNRGPGIDHRWSGPMIDLGVPGSPLTIRAFYPVRGFPDMDPADMPRAYDAMRHFSQIAAEDRFQMNYPFQPGDVVGFDNRRILHGRDAYESGGHRHLRGIYIDHDEVRSFARVHGRRRAQAL